MFITVVGAGIGGLSAAIDLSQRQHSVTLVEDKDGLSEFGAGLQMSPNAIRILQRWEVASAVEKVAFVPDRTLVRRYDSGSVLGKVEQNPLYQDAYGFPYVEYKGRPDFTDSHPDTGKSIARICKGPCLNVRKIWESISNFLPVSLT